LKLRIANRIAAEKSRLIAEPVKIAIPTKFSEKILSESAKNKSLDTKRQSAVHAVTIN